MSLSPRTFTLTVALALGMGGWAQCTNYTFTVTSGTWPWEVGWSFIGPGGNTVATGGAPSSAVFCLPNGCYTLNMSDSWGDGWNGATYTLAVQSTGAVVASGTLNSGSFGSVQIGVGVTCNSGPGPVTAGDCPIAVNVCTNINFQIDPNGYGSLYEIPPLGTMGNPLYNAYDGQLSPWGTDNYGCLQAGELNSTWMVVNIWGSGWLEFTFGGLGTQAGYYDWIMYPYTPGSCSAITSNQVAPVRCNWNGVSYGGTGLASITPFGSSGTNFEPALYVTAGQQYIICFSNWSSVTTTVPLVFGGTAVVSCLPLPVVLVDLAADPLDDAIDVTWTTSSETNSAWYHVERSADLSTWEKIGSMPAAGRSTNLIDYRFKDTSPLPGTNYYRLMQVDHDGSFLHSHVVSALWGDRRLSCYPNPGDGTLFVIGLEPGTPLAVLDAMGRQVGFDRLDDLVGSVRITLHEPQDGLYSIRAGSDEAPLSGRFVVAAP